MSLRTLAHAACVLGLASIAGAASAGVVTNRIVYPSGPTSMVAWPVAYDWASFADTTAAINPVPEGNYGTPVSLAQSFLATKSGLLSHVQIEVTGGMTGGIAFNLNLYERLGTYDVTDTTNGFTPGTNVSNNLFSSALPASFNPPLQSGQSAVLDFAFSGVDQVPMTAGKYYVFEITSSDPNIGNMFIIRNGASNYAEGQAYRGRAALNGATNRDLAIAVTVPEPATMSVIGVAAAALLCRRGRRA